MSYEDGMEYSNDRKFTTEELLRITPNDWWGLMQDREAVGKARAENLQLFTPRSRQLDAKQLR